MVAPSALIRSAPLRRSRTTLRLIHAPHAAPYTMGFGLRRARRGRGSRAVVVRFMSVEVDKQGRLDNLMTRAGQNFSEFRFFYFSQLGIVFRKVSVS
jgi:hypothetical protein